MILYRPVGLEELRLLAASGWNRWPDRLPHQPIFYPVLTLEYARQIARDWNTVDEASGFAGFVTRFEVEDSFIEPYPVQTAGSRLHQELWVPADDLATLNDHIVGAIKVVDAYAGGRYPGAIDFATCLLVGW